mgnify:CR=1 FL=1
MSNEPYKSRLLNFINRQTIRWQDKLGMTVRRLRSTTEMGIQLLLYPFYVMLQTGRTLRERLESKVQSPLFLSEARSSHTESSLTTASVPLEEVLNLVEPWLQARENSDNIATNTVDILPVDRAEQCADLWQSTPSLPPKKQSQVTDSQLDNLATQVTPVVPRSSQLIRGVASVLASREIVLVDRHNRILNILNPRQQQILKQYLAKRHQQPGLLITTTRKILANLPQISQKNSAKTTPIKFIWQMLDWVQTSPIATKVNLFGESKLASYSPVLPSSNPVLYKGKFLTSLDNKVADLETKSFLSTSVPFDDLDRDFAQNQAYLDSNPFKFRAIIKAAID